MWGYIGSWIPQVWVHAPLSKFERVLFFELRIKADGQIPDRQGWPDQFVELRWSARQHKVPLDLTLALDAEEAFSPLFESPAAISRLLDLIERLAQHDDVSGIQLDIEVYRGASQKSIQGYRAFVLELNRRLKAQLPARYLSVFLPVGGDLQIYDAPTLESVDRVVVQGYDAAWRTGPEAGPVAPLDGPTRVTWQKAIALSDSLRVPRSKILMGFPLYGYEWPTKDRSPRGPTAGEGAITTPAHVPIDRGHRNHINIRERIGRHGCVNDALSGSSFYQLQRPDGQWSVGWFEGAWAVARKREYMRQERVGGVAFFMLGYDGYEIVNRFSESSRATARIVRGESASPTSPC